jgi:hypothetical protein
MSRRGEEAIYPLRGRVQTMHLYAPVVHSWLVAEELDGSNRDIVSAGDQRPAEVAHVLFLTAAYWGVELADDQDPKPHGRLVRHC